MIDALIALYKTHFGATPKEVIPLRAHASERKIYRLNGDAVSVCGVHNPYPIENRAFIYFASVFHTEKLPVPKVIASSADDLVYLLDDLGDTTLYDVLLSCRSEADPFPHAVSLLYEKALSELPRFQVDAAKHIDFTKCFQTSEFGEASMLSDMEYFLNSFLAKTEIPFDSALLKEDFGTFAMYALEAPRNYFMYRDFQARNIMIQDGKPFFIDFQGGRKGALQYDVASLLYQSSAHLPEAARNRLCQGYLKALQQSLPAYTAEMFFQYYDRFIMLRMMQVLGTYGKQGLEKGKTYFAKSIPPAVETFYTVAKRDGILQRLPELAKILDRLICHEQFGTRVAG